jgi:hypothetical protein
MSDPLIQASVLQYLEHYGCGNIHTDWFSLAMIAIDWWPLYLGIFVIGIFFMQNEIYWWIWSWWIFLQFFVNWGIREAVGQPGPEPRCSSLVQCPSYNTDGMTFIILYIAITSGMTLRVNVGWFKVFLITFFAVFSTFARMWLHINTPQQLLWGVLAGFVWALFASIVTRFLFFTPQVYEFLMTSRFMGIFEDRLIGIHAFIPHLRFEQPIDGVYIEGPAIGDWANSFPNNFILNELLHN